VPTTRAQAVLARAVLGDPNWIASHTGRTHYFTDAAATKRELFKRIYGGTPDKEKMSLCGTWYDPRSHAPTEVCMLCLARAIESDDARSSQ